MLHLGPLHLGRCLAEGNSRGKMQPVSVPQLHEPSKGTPFFGLIKVPQR